jgi:hypothetical protein
MTEYDPQAGGYVGNAKTDDIATFVRTENESGNAERDPYGYAVTVIATTLEFALDDGISGAMNERECTILELLARVLMATDPAIEIDPRAG